MLLDYFLRAALIVLLSSVMVQPAHASGTVSQRLEQVPPDGEYVWQIYGPPSTTGPSVGPLCDIKLAYQGFVAPNYAPYAPLKINDNRYQCRFQNVYNGAIGESGYIDKIGGPTCPSGYTLNDATGMCERYVCPENSSLVGGECVCIDPMTPDISGTMCGSPICPNYGDLAGKFWIETGTDPATVSTAGIGRFCKTGCSVDSFEDSPLPNPNTGSAVVDGVTHYYAYRAYSYTGGTCDISTMEQIPNPVPEPAPSCPAAGTVAVSGTFDVGTDYNKVQPGILSGCGANNCATEIASLDPISQRGKIGGVYHYYAVGVIVFNGQTCQPGVPAVVSTTNPSTLQQTCATGEVGVMSTGGILNCYKDGAISGASAPPVTETITERTITTDPVTGVSSVIETQTIRETSGSGSGASNQDVPPELQDFCQQNPTSELCKGKNDISEFCAEHPDFFICKEQDFGDVPDENLTDKEVNVAINPVAVGGAGSCPAPASFTIAGRTAYFDYTTYCNYASGIKPILLAFAWLAAAGILIGGFKT